MKRYEIKLPIPTEGINLLSSNLIADNEAAEGTVNISFKNNIPTTRNGYIKKNTHNFTDDAHTILNYQKDGSMIAIVAAKNTLYKKTNETTFEAITGTLNSDIVSAVNHSFAFASPDTYGDKIFVLDGANYRYFKDSGALVDVPAYSPTTDEQSKYGTNVLSTTPDEIKKQRWIIKDNDRFWVAGYKNIVRIGHLGQPGYFPSTQVWKLAEDCTGIAQFSDEVIMFTEHTATLIKGSTPDWNLPDKYIRKSLPTRYGCSQHRSIAVGNGSLYWASRGGVFRYRQLPDGTYEPECISEIEVKRGGKKHIRTVQPLIKSVNDWSKVFAVFHDNEYRLCLGDERWLIWDSIGSTWTLYKYDKTFNHAVTYLDDMYGVKNYLYHMDYINDGTTYDGLSDDGTAIEFYLYFKVHDFNKAANKKIFNKIYFTMFSEMVSYNIDLTLLLDNERARFTGTIDNKVSRIGEFAFGDRINTKKTNLNYPIQIIHNGTKYNIQPVLHCNTLNQAFGLANIDLVMKIKELK